MNMKLRTDENSVLSVYDLSDPVYRLRLDMSGLEVYGGFKTKIGNADTLNYLNLGINISGAIPVTRNPQIGITLPMWLSTDFTRVRSTRQQSETDQFRESSASVGLGIGLFYKLSQNIRFQAESVPQIGFTVTSLGADSGQIMSLNNRLRLYFDQLTGRYGLLIGYDYSWRRYSGGEERFHYDMTSNNVSLGVSF
ncbi:MAG: hypothetical protein WD272_02365 [Balneolales bacterium]